MSLQKQKVYLPLTEGLNTKSDDKFVVPGEVTLLENGVYVKDNTITKKYGFSNLTTSYLNGSGLSNTRGLYSYRDELLLETESNIYSYSPTNTQWVSKGTLNRSSATVNQIIRNNNEQTDLQFATLNNIRVFAWKDDRGGIRYSVQDVVTGLNYVADVSLSSTGAAPRIVTSNNVFYICYYITTNIHYKTIDPSTPTTLSSQSTLVSDVHASVKTFDLTTLGTTTSTNIYLLYANTAKELITKKYNYNLTSLVATNTHVPTDIDNVAIATSTVSGTSYLHTVWFDGAGSVVRFRIIDTAFVEVLASTVLNGGGNGVLITGVQITSSSHNVQWFTSSGFSDEPFGNEVATMVGGPTGVVSVAVILSTDLRLATKAFALNGVAYAGVSVTLDPQGTLFFIDASKNILSKIAPGETGPGEDLTVLGSVETSGSTVTAAFNKLGEFKVEENIGRTLKGYSIVSLETSPAVSASSALLNNNLYVAAGTLYVYDGVSFFEDGFSFFPTVINTVPGTSGDIENGTYQWVVVYEWLDNQGNLHRSAPSAVIEHTFSGSDDGSILIRTTPLTLTRKDISRSSVNAVIYRTEDNGSVFYRVGSTVNSAVIVDFTDTLIDTDITSNEILYTQGGILENIQPPTCDIVIAHNNRLVLGGLEDGNVIRFSKPATQNVAPGFNEGLELRLNSEGGRVTGLASMDSKLIFFKNNSIYYSTGDGPDKLGSGFFTEPQLISSVLGAESQNSVINTPIGILFKSLKGFYLLSRSLELVPIGDKLIDFNSNTISSSVSILGRDEIRLCTTDGNILVFNYHYQKWSVFTSLASVGSAIWNNQHVIVTSAGQAKYEDSSTYLDNGTFRALKIRTGWVQIDEVSGLQRIYRVNVVGEYQTPHKLHVDVSYDYDSATIESHELAISADPKQYGYDVQHKRQKCSAVQYTIYDVVPTSATGTGQGFSLSGLRLLCGIKNKLSNSPATRKL